jgi:YVTN family beta-propeller protein
MKSKLVLVAACFLLYAVGTSQWLETTVLLPDSLGGMGNPQCFAYDSANNTVYVGGERGECVLAIDGATNERVARIPAGSNVSALCYNPQNNKVYCANRGGNDVAVIDGATNQVVATVAVGAGPVYLACDSVQSRVYAANANGSSISAIWEGVIGIGSGVVSGVPMRALAVSPNPIRGRSSIRFQLTAQSRVRLSVCDVTGRTVATLADGVLKSGAYARTWNATDDRKRQLPRGVYFVRLETPNCSENRKVVLE